MKRLLYSFLIISVPVISYAGNKEFYYDKVALSDEFSQLDKVSSYVEGTNVSYHELSSSHVFEGKLELNNTIALKPNLKFEDVAWGSFAWGFCCAPVGIFTVLINDDKDKNSKDSFWAGLVSAAIPTSVYLTVFFWQGFSSF